MAFRKGDKVWWWSAQGGKKNRRKAVFLTYDEEGYPKRDCILVIKVSDMPHDFRWPLKYIEKV